MISPEKIRSLIDQSVNIQFKDGCSLDLQILETMHVEEGNDFICEIINIRCEDKNHFHSEIGNSINIRLEDIKTIKPLKNS